MDSHRVIYPICSVFVAAPTICVFTRISYFKSGDLSLKFIRLLRVVFSSQQRLNRPAVNAVQWRHSLPEKRIVIWIG